MKTIDSLFAALISSTLLTASVSADLLIYEPFDYADTGPTSDTAFLGDGNQAGGLGLGQWRQVIAGVHEIEVFSPGLTFTDTGGNVLPSAGGRLYRFNRVGQAAVSSDVDSSATAALTADNSTMWMSFLYQDRGFSGPTSAIMLASEDMIASDNHNLNTAGFGVGVAIRDSGNMTRAINTAYYNGTTSYTRATEATPTFLVSGGPENTVFLLAIKVNWKPDGTPDEIFVFNITDLTTEPDEADALASDTFDMLLVNQQSLDVLNVGETQVDDFDEIRLATTFAGVVGAVPADTFDLVIAPNASTPGNYDFSWESQDGKLYDLVSAPDLSTALDTWAVWDSRMDLAATSPTNTLTDIPGGGDPRRFFAIIEKDAPPPPPIFEASFDTDDDGFTSSKTEGTDWVRGVPASNGIGGSVTTDNGGTGACWGTDIGNPGYFVNPTTATTLRSPNIDLSTVGAAELSFAQALDIPGSDSAIVRVFKVSDDSEIVSGPFPLTVIDDNTADATWKNAGPYALPVGEAIYIEWIFSGTGGATADYLGWYVDDVVITGN